MSPPRIITFYSYKGGAGRSMALANVAWILASNGKRVLVIDWDLEAPGLHRYLHPFLNDKELTSSEGLIDFVVQYADRAVTKSKGTKRNWYEPYANILRYASSLNYPFPNKGTIDFVPAGRQGPDYATRVNSFNWQHFYERLDGGIFFEAAKESMAHYDYVLIDSRTGVSDTSGICTVQMPHVLVVCFTLNIQSIEGAAAVAESADAQRRNDKGERTLKIFPVPTRVELTERDKLKAALEVARERFDPLLEHLGRRRDSYWESVEVLYQPFYAYEEILAVFGDSSGKANSMLSAMETLAGHVSGAGDPLLLPSLTQAERDDALLKYSRVPPTTVPNLIHRLQGHSEGVRAVSLSADGRLALSGSEDNTLKLWDLTTGRCLRTFSGHADWIQAVALSSDGKRGVSGSNDNTVIVWNVTTGKSVKRLTGHSESVYAVAATPDGNHVLSGSADNSVILWNMKTGRPLRTLQGHAGPVAAVAVSADGRFAVSGSYDKIVVLWDLQSGKTIRTFSGHTRGVAAVSLSADGRLLLTGSSDQTLMLWDVESGEAIRTISGHAGRIYAVDMSADGRHAVSGSGDRLVILWNLQTGQLLRSFSGHSGSVNSVRLSADGRAAVSASDDGTLIVWDLSTAMNEVKEVVAHPEPLTPQVSRLEQTKEADPWFYISFAKADGDVYFQQFVSDLSIELAALLGPSISLFQDLSLAESWSEGIRHAVRTCKVAICILTPTYFQSESCGREFQVFRDRSSRSGSRGIFPISWIPVKPMPRLISEMQIPVENFSEVYAKEGLAYLMRLSRYRDEYQALIQSFARHLLSIASSSPLTKLPQLPPVDAILNAFRFTGSPAPLEDQGPLKVTFAFAAETPFGKPLFLIAMDVASNLKLFASQVEVLGGDKVLVDQIKITARNNSIFVITLGPESIGFLHYLRDELQRIDVTHCAVLVLSGKDKVEPSGVANLGYVASNIQSESAFRAHLESAIVKIRHSMISKSPATSGDVAGASTPSLPSTT